MQAKHIYKGSEIWITVGPINVYDESVVSVLHSGAFAVGDQPSTAAGEFVKGRGGSTKLFKNEKEAHDAALKAATGRIDGTTRAVGQGAWQRQ